MDSGMCPYHNFLSKLCNLIALLTLLRHHAPIAMLSFANIPQKEILLNTFTPVLSRHQEAPF